MAKQESLALQLIPPHASLKALAEAARDCRACDLYKNATQAVFGEGVAKAEVTATVHPSSILRAPDEDTRHREMEQFVKDLRAVARQMN